MVVKFEMCLRNTRGEYAGTDDKVKITYVTVTGEECTEQVSLVYFSPEDETVGLKIRETVQVVLLRDIKDFRIMARTMVE